MAHIKRREQLAVQAVLSTLKTFTVFTPGPPGCKTKLHHSDLNMDQNNLSDQTN